MTEISENSSMATMTTPGPFEGMFSGSVRGDNGSQAPIALKVTHRNEKVEGMLTIGEGLYVSGGRCGGAKIPSSKQYFSARTRPGKPNLLSTQFNVRVSKLKIGLEFVSLISDDGKMITSKVSIDLPWICGCDPELTGTLYRSE